MIQQQEENKVTCVDKLKEGDTYPLDLSQAYVHQTFKGGIFTIIYSIGWVSLVIFTFVNYILNFTQIDAYILEGHDYDVKTINYNDIIFIPSMETIANDITKPENVSKTNNAKLVRNYHKYIDKSKAPNTIGSQKNEIKIDKNYTEANLSQEDSTPIVLRNGRIYFGNNSNVECSTDGITASDFNIQKLKNEL
jgi:hypothetical protein